MDNTMKVHTLLFFRNMYEDTSWECIPFSSSQGYDSIEEMVLNIGKALRRHLQEILINNARFTKKYRPEQYKREHFLMSEENMELLINNNLFNKATIQHLDAWEELQDYDINVYGNIYQGAIVPIFYGQEVLLQAMLGNRNTLALLLQNAELDKQHKGKIKVYMDE